MKLDLSPKPFLRLLCTELAEFRHRMRLWRLALGHDARYRAYLRVQLERTLSKRNRDPGVRAKLLYDVRKVVNEIIRVARPGALVAIEVPVQYETGGAALIDFGSLPKLHAAFEPNIAQVLWCGKQEPLSPSNPEGVAVIRTIFSIEK